MTPLTSILVDIDVVFGEHPALDHAVALAARSGARVKIVDVLPAVPNSVRHFVTESLEQELVAHRQERLDGIAGRVKQVPVSVGLLRGRPGNALIQEVLRGSHDLLVRSHGRDPVRQARRYGAIDMELLRQCPCPVWLIGRNAPDGGPARILAAIHANPSDAVEQGLNVAILEWALLFRGFWSADLTLLQAWNPFGASLLRSRLSPDQFAEYVDTTRRSAEEALSTLIEPFRDRLVGVAVELVQGEPEDVISRFVAAHAIHVVVMGTVARTGIAGLLMGNTAERVLQDLDGSVLAIKPAGFESPISAA
jgi:nucleotide-binding universal stress UspA family protein